MHSHFLALIVLPAAALAATYSKACAVGTASYPAPSLLSSSSSPGYSYVAAAINSSQTQIQQVVSGAVTDYGQITGSNAIAVQVYSIYDNDTTAPLFSFYNTPAGLASNTSASTLEADTTVRIGSVSKLWTAYIYLAAAGDVSWGHPITEYVPELAALTATSSNSNSMDYVDWSEITVGSLMSQLSGVARDAAYLPSLQSEFAALGLPNAGGFAHSTCSYPGGSITIPCNRTVFFEDFPSQHPVFAPYTAPAYSNAAFQIAGYALENITGTSMDDLFHTHLVQSLDLQGSYYRYAPDNTTAGFVPYNNNDSLWGADARDMSPAGGFYSTANDVRRVGAAILRSSQLSSAQTRRWMRPQAFIAADPNTAVGTPWEITREPASDNDTAAGVPAAWIYTKSGDLGLYATEVALLPELGLGFHVLAAGDDATMAISVLSDILAETWAPAVRQAAAAEATYNYVGTYTDAATNSSLILQNDAAGLWVTKWLLDGIDVLDLLGEIEGVTTGQTVSMRLWPTGLKSITVPGNSTTVTTTPTSWRATFQSLPETANSGPFSTNCLSWFALAAIAYGGVALDEFVLSVDEAGAAVSLQPRMIGTTLLKSE